jgi:hypothetical protein
LEQIRRLLTAPLRLLWRGTGQPFHHRLFGRYFRATIGRLDSALGGLQDQRTELDAIRSEVSEIHASQIRIEEQLAMLAADHWDAAALVRRLSMLEDGLIESRNGTPDAAGAEDLRPAPRD